MAFPMPQQPPAGANAGAMQTEQRALGTQSILNPTDASMMAQNGTIDPSMTVDDFLKNVLKIDPQGPVTQLIDAYKTQSQNANPAHKMSAIAGDSGGPAPTGQPQAPPAPAGGGGLRSILGG